MAIVPNFQPPQSPTSVPEFLSNEIMIQMIVTQRSSEASKFENMVREQIASEEVRIQEEYGDTGEEGALGAYGRADL